MKFPGSEILFCLFLFSFLLFSFCSWTVHGTDGLDFFTHRYARHDDLFFYTEALSGTRYSRLMQCFLVPLSMYHPKLPLNRMGTQCFYLPK